MPQFQKLGLTNKQTNATQFNVKRKSDPSLLRRITFILAHKKGEDEAETQGFLVQRVGMEIHQWNAVRLADRVRRGGGGGG